MSGSFFTLPRTKAAANTEPLPAWMVFVEKNWENFIVYLKKRTSSPDDNKVNQHLAAEEVVCCICCEVVTPDNCVTLPCHARHTFHLSCIKQWCDTSPVCPYDRTEVGINDLLPNLPKIDMARFVISVLFEGITQGALFWLELVALYNIRWDFFISRLVSSRLAGYLSRSLTNTQRIQEPLKDCLAFAIDFTGAMIQSRRLGEMVLSYHIVSFFSNRWMKGQGQFRRIFNVGYDYRFLYESHPAANKIFMAGAVLGFIFGRFGERFIYSLSSSIISHVLS